VLIEVLPEQPPKGINHIAVGNNRVLFQFVEEDCPEEDEYTWIKLPLPIGEVGLRYRDRRDKGTITDVRVCRIQNIKLPEIFKTGIKGADETITGSDAIYEYFKSWFNTRYARPRKRVKDGKVWYECWCWCAESFALHYLHNNRWTANAHGKGWHDSTWKDKPLTIHLNPFVTVAKVRKGLK